MRIETLSRRRYTPDPTPIRRLGRLLAQLEGILLDPVNTGKAAAGLIDLVRCKHFKQDSKILFVHTDGAPSLFAYQGVVQS